MGERAKNLFRFPLKGIWARLTRPSNALSAPADYQKARLMASLLLSLFGLFVILLIVLPLLNVTIATAYSLHNKNFLAGLITMVLIGITYPFSRTRYYQFAALTLAVLLSVMLFVAAIPDKEFTQIYMLNYLLLVAVLASMFTSIRFALFLLNADLTLIILFTLLYAPDQVSNIFLGPFSLNLIGGVLLITGAQHRNRLEIQRQLELAENEERYRHIIENTYEGVWIIDAGGYTVYVNDRILELLGYARPEEMLGRPVLDFCDPADAAQVYRNLELRKQSIGEQHDFKFLRKDGSYFWALVNASPLKDNNGQFVGSIALIADITARKMSENALQKSKEELERRVVERTTALEEANRKLLTEIAERQKVDVDLQETTNRIKEILDSVNEGFFSLDRQWRFTYINPQAERLLRLNRDECLGRNIWSVAPSVATLLPKLSEQQLQAERSAYNDEIYVKNIDTWFEANVTINKDNLSVFFHDITARKRAEIEVLLTLEKERELSELKARFITATSHEFRTPLSTILTSAELLEFYHNKLSEERRLEILQRITGSVQRMTELLDDVLTVDKAEAGQLEFNPVELDPAQLCQEIVGEISKGFGGDHQLVLVSNGNCKRALLDKKLLQLALSNLLTNAVKYSPVGSEIKMEFECQAQHLIFKVIDSGIGIPLPEQEKIFDVFYRASNVKNESGTGLGLAIVQRSVDLHRGTITLNSELGVGSTFTIKLPWQPISEPE
ncbi:MAG TPA: PAS domain S-box protein [Chloroflexia bacterium]|nr:PAS domain S-box protein [Chloroflexia bacterium]